MDISQYKILYITRKYNSIVFYTWENNRILKSDHKILDF